jgi:phage terminase large subunit
MKVKLHKNQYQIAVDKTRFKVLCAGRRFGKSVLARMTTLKWATDYPGRFFWIVSPTYQMAKDIHWKDGFNLEIPQDWIEKKNEQDLEVVLKNGSRISLRSADKPDRLRGVRLGGLVVDEVASMRNWNDIWQAALRPTLTDYQSPALFISTPKGYNHFYELWERGQKENKEWKSWKFSTYDNPFIPKEEIETAKKELDEDAFAQEYLAEFKKFTGLVYKNFKREVNVIEPIELQENWSYYRSIDFGWVNPTAVLFIAIDDKGRIIIFDFINTFADPAQMSDIEELRKYGLSIQPVSKTSSNNTEDWTTFRIRKVSEKIQNQKLFVFKNCTNTIFEFENYQYKEVRDGAYTKEIPAKINDHLMDALSYFIVSLPERVEAEYDDFERHLNELPKDNLFTKDGFY